MADLKTVVGQNLRLLRARANLNQAELADRVDRSVNMIGKIERGEIAPSFDTIERLCTDLGAVPAELFLTDGASLEELEGRFAAIFSITRRLNDRELERAVGILRAAFE
ncbi:MAG: helix-turn-helix transcriptional regulator [Oceanicaulis sp.]|jgi:transcriptional regulator with XRE-family HTH domain|nr:helix-turn-helix transcriptional regulator [Oceanicaulis sp.]